MKAPPRHRRSPALIAWALFMFLIPFYVFGSGMAQPGDFLIVLVLPLSLAGWNGRLERRFRDVFSALMRFTALVLLVDLVWLLLLWSATVSDLMFPLYYVYDAAVFFAAFVLYQRFGDAFLRVTLNTLLASLAFQTLASFGLAAAGSGARSTVFFHNPNQLGYYALLAGCLVAISYRHLRFGILKTSLAMAGCAYLGLLSASRSAVAGIALLVVVMLISNPRVLWLASIVAIALTLAGGPVETSIDTLQDRVSRSNTPELNFFEQRGYDRIWANKEYAILGAGEGANWRFAETTEIGGTEIHSSAGTILFCYGIAGVLLFGAFIVSIVRGARWRMGLMLLPPLSYTLAHQGLRFTMLWVLLAVFVAFKGNAPRPRPRVVMVPA